MNDKKSKTVRVGKIKRHKAPGSSGPPYKVRHYGVGWDGSNKTPKPAPAPSSGDYWAG